MTGLLFCQKVEVDSIPDYVKRTQHGSIYNKFLNPIYKQIPHLAETIRKIIVMIATIIAPPLLHCITYNCEIKEKNLLKMIVII